MATGTRAIPVPPLSESTIDLLWETRKEEPKSPNKLKVPALKGRTPPQQ